MARTPSGPHGGPPPQIPDADGPAPGLDAALRAIDARYGGLVQRRLLRAAACWEHGDVAGVHRELQVGLAEFADDRGLPRREIMRMIRPAQKQAVRDALRRLRGEN